MNVLIIGASRGIGLELVRQYRADGAIVTATARREDGLQRLRDLGAGVIKLDVADATSAAGLAWPIDGAAFDVVVVNAGVYGPRSDGPGPAEPGRLRPGHAHQCARPDARAAADSSTRWRRGARVAVISSRMGSIGSRTGSSGWLYRASKAALNSVLKDASLVLDGRAICVAFHPGWVRTDMGGAGADLDVADSVAGIRRTLAGLKPADNGGFFNYDGAPIPW